MIESLVNIFAKNNYSSKRSPESSSGDFQQTLSKYDQRIQRQGNRSNDSTYNYQEDYQNTESRDFQSEEYSDSHEVVEHESEEPRSEDAAPEEYSDSYDVVEHESEEPRSEDAAPEEESSESTEGTILEFLNELGIGKEEVAKLLEAIKNGDASIVKEELSGFIDKLNSVAKTGLLDPKKQEQLTKLVQKLDGFVKSNDQNLLKNLSNVLKTDLQKVINPKNVLKEQIVDQGSVDRTQKDIQNNNEKFAEMKEAAKDSKSLKFRSDVDVKFSQDSSKSNQAVQNKSFAAGLEAKNTTGQKTGGGEQQGNPGDLAGKSPDFLKKMKNILKVNSQSPQNSEAVTEQQSKLQQGNSLRPSFMNRATTGRFMQQLVNQIQNMVKSNSTLSASVDFKSAEFGDMKLAAEAQGTSLAVKLSNIASSLKLDVASLRSELDSELKSLGFDNIELDFGDKGESSNRHAFEEEMNKRLGRDQVKLPGDHLADLNAIDEWMKNFQKVM